MIVAPLSFLVLGAALFACGSRQNRPADNHANNTGCDIFSETTRTIQHVESFSLSDAENVEQSWQELQDFAQCTHASSDECHTALVRADDWWSALRAYAQALFIPDEAPDAETVRQWTVNRQRFFEQWLATPQPILVMEDGIFVLSKETGGRMMEWAKCANDRQAFELWEQRTERLSH